MIAWVIWADKMWLPEYTGVVSSNAVQYGPPSYSIEADFAELERLRERAMVALSKSSFIKCIGEVCVVVCVVVDAHQLLLHLKIHLPILRVSWKPWLDMT